MLTFAKAQTFRSALEQVAFAGDPELGLRYAFSAVKVEIVCPDLEGGYVRLIATDGKRMAIKQVLCNGSNKHRSFLLPLKGANQFLKKCTQSAKGGLDLALTQKGECVFMWKGYRNKDMRIECDILDGRFPNWKEVVDQDHPRLGQITGKVEGMLPETKRFQDDIRCTLDLNGQVLIKKEAIRLDNVKYEGDTQSIYFDPDLLIDWLNTVPEKSDVRIDVFGPNYPVRCYADGASDYLFMPCATP